MIHTYIVGKSNSDDLFEWFREYTSNRGITVGKRSKYFVGYKDHIKDKVATFLANKGIALLGDVKCHVGLASTKLLPEDDVIKRINSYENIVYT